MTWLIMVPLNFHDPMNQMDKWASNIWTSLNLLSLSSNTNSIYAGAI